MTNGEAIKIIKKYDVNGCGYCHQGGDEVEEAFQMAISALEQTDGDLISRKDLLKVITDLKKSPWFNDGKDIKDLFRHNSYVVRKEAIEIIEDLCIKKLPSAEKTAEWIIDEYIDENGYCSNCNFYMLSEYVKGMKYCPNCGARMKESEEEE